MLGQMVRPMVARGLRVAGAGVGGYLAPGVGADVGRKFGGAVSQIMGFGDYKISQNTVMSAPRFAGVESVRIRHREFIGDISTAVTFTNSTFPINPANRKTFPWLSGMVNSFQQYKVHGMVFYFNSTSATAVSSTNTALGTMIMATNYDSREPAYASKIEMAASYYSDSGKPCDDLIHAIECDPSTRPTDVLYIDHNGEGVDHPELYNVGLFQIASTGAQAASVAGELWVSYDIEFLKTRYADNPLGTFYSASTFTNAAPLGTTVGTVTGTQCTFTSTTIDLTPYRGRVVEVVIAHTGTTITWTVPVAFTLTSGLTAYNMYSALTTNSRSANNSGSSAAFAAMYVIPTATSPNILTISLTTSAGTLSNVQVYIHEINDDYVLNTYY